MTDGELGGRILLLNILRRNMMREETADCQLYHGQFPVLETIIHCPDTTQAMLAEQLHVTPASIALSTKRLEKAGLIERRVDPENRRCNLLQATEAGRVAADVYRRGFDAVEARTLAGFSEEDKQRLMELLNRMIKNLAGSETVYLFPFCKEDIHP